MENTGFIEKNGDGEDLGPARDETVQLMPKESGVTELLAKAAIVAAVLSLLSGCNALNRLNEVGSPPRLASVQDPSRIAGATPVSMPMPRMETGERLPNSLWRTGSRTFFRDQRAGRVGDVLTVVISIDEKAQLQNQTKRSRQNSDDADVTNLFGYEGKLAEWFPTGVDPTSLVRMGSNTSNDGKGSVDRSEKINLRVAAVVTQVLPNGNLVIAGRQQVVVNYDLRELRVTGVIRPEDVSSENTVSYDQIAEARIAYGGRGMINDMQQPRYGSQVLDILMPF